MNRKIIVFILMIIFVLPACRDSKTGNNVTSADVVYKIKKKVKIQDSITIIPSEEAEQTLGMKNSELLKVFYYIPDTLLADYMILTNLINVKNEEISLFKIKDEKDRETIRKGMEKRIADKKKESYLPDTIKSVDNATIGESGSFIYLVIWDENLEKRTIISTIKDTTK